MNVNIIDHIFSIFITKICYTLRCFHLHLLRLRKFTRSYSVVGYHSKHMGTVLILATWVRIPVRPFFFVHVEIKEQKQNNFRYFSVIDFAVAMLELSGNAFD